MKTLLISVLLFALIPMTAIAEGSWSTMQVQGSLNFVRLVMPYLGGEGGDIAAGTTLQFGASWRQTDDSADGFKTLGFYAGVSFEANNPFDFNFIEPQIGVTAALENSETGDVDLNMLFGTGLWIGNKTEMEIDPETGDEFTFRVPGLSLKHIFVLGAGAASTPS